MCAAGVCCLQYAIISAAVQCACSRTFTCSFSHSRHADWPMLKWHRLSNTVLHWSLYKKQSTSTATLAAWNPFWPAAHTTGTNPIDKAHVHTGQTNNKKFTELYTFTLSFPFNGVLISTWKAKLGWFLLQKRNSSSWSLDGCRETKFQLTIFSTPEVDATRSLVSLLHHFPYSFGYTRTTQSKFVWVLLCNFFRNRVGTLA